MHIANYQQLSIIELIDCSISFSTSHAFVQFSSSSFCVTINFNAVSILLSSFVSRFFIVIEQYNSKNSVNESKFFATKRRRFFVQFQLSFLRCLFVNVKQYDLKISVNELKFFVKNRRRFLFVRFSTFFFRHQ